MGIFGEIKERRLLPFMGAYLVTGFVALEGVDQLVSYEILPIIAYRIALIFYVFGIPGSLTIAWFHGAKGRQDVPKAEIFIQGILLVAAIAISVVTVRNARVEERQAAEALASGLEVDRIAVLYFEDFSPGGDLGYVADGLTEALIDELSAVRSLSVVSRNGVEPFRGSEIPIDSIARLLDVGSVIRGTVDETRNGIRVTTVLVDGFTGADIERNVVEISNENFLAVRDSVAANVALLLRERLGQEVQLQGLKAGTESVEAWSFVQRAERLISQAEDLRNDDDLAGGLDQLLEADSLLVLAESADPAWVRPPAVRAHAAFRRAFFTATGTGDLEAASAIIEEGREEAEKAIGLEARNAYALEQRGALKYLLYLLDLSTDSEEADRLLESAQEDLEAAVDIDPTLATAYSMLSHLHYNRSDMVAVILNARRAYEEDAYLRDANRILERLFWAHYDMEQFRDARKWCTEGAERFPEDHVFEECQLWLMLLSDTDADVDRAWELRDQFVERAPQSIREYNARLGNLLVGGVLRQAGLQDSAEAMFEQGASDESVDPLADLWMYQAAIRSTTGDLEGAVQYLSRWLAANPSAELGSEGNLHWWWRKLRDEPGFEGLQRR
jgi:TolB-like protein